LVGADTRIVFRVSHDGIKLARVNAAASEGGGRRRTGIPNGKQSSSDLGERSPP
jgi:hypothetical protein